MRSALIGILCAVLPLDASCHKLGAMVTPTLFQASSAKQPNDPFWFERVSVALGDADANAWDYELRMRNDNEYAVLVNVTIEYLDVGGQVVHDFHLPNVTLRPKDETVLTGIDQIPPATARRIARVRGAFH